MTTFLDPNYEVPQSPSNYMKFKPGSNRFRILSPAITGYSYWNMMKKPVRQKQKFDLIPADIKIENGKVTDIKHFWAFIVWNYSDNMIQILEITQASVQRAMKIKIDNRQGDATGYDFIVTREGEGMLTEYDIDTGDKEPVSDEIQKMYEAKKINLEALYSGADPFAVSGSTSESSQSPKTAPTGRDKFEQVANSLPHQNRASQQRVAPDIQEVADQMESEDMGSEIPF